MWNDINLEKVLKKEKNKQEQKKPDQILKAFKNILTADDALNDSVAKQIFKKEENDIGNINWSSLDPENIYTHEQVYRLCKHYRLRFLPAKHFKGKIPCEALSKVKKLYRGGNGNLSDFRILAPAPVFNLVNKDKDPLLFLSLGSGHYYLVHKWGKDLSAWRKILVFPFRSFKTLLGCVAALAFLIVSIIPDSVMMGPYDSTSLNLRVIFFFYLFIAFSGLTALYGFSRIKNFNGTLWDSRYID